MSDEREAMLAIEDYRGLELLEYVGGGYTMYVRSNGSGGYVGTIEHPFVTLWKTDVEDSYDLAEAAIRRLLKNG